MRKVVFLIILCLMSGSILNGAAFTPAVETAAVLIPSSENPFAFDIHLLFIPRRASAYQRGMAVLYLPYESFQHLISLPREVSDMSSQRLKGKLRELFGVTPSIVYRTDGKHNLAAGEVLSRLQGFDDPVEFSYGSNSIEFWSILIRQAEYLSDDRVLPLLEAIYDEQQVSSRRFSRGISRLAELAPRLRSIPVITGEDGRLPYDGRLVQEQIRQILVSLEGE